MFIPGPHAKKPSKNTNDELLKLEGVLDDETAKVTFAQFLYANPTFAVQMLFGVKLYTEQQILIRAMFKKDFGLFVLSRGFGKCLNEDDLVYTNNGVKPIKDAQVGEYIQAEKEPQLIVNKIENEIRKGYLIKTNKGTEFSGIEGHRTLVYNPETFSMDYKHIENIKIGDYVVAKLGGNLWGSDDLLSHLGDSFNWKSVTNEEIAYFIGLLVGDGHVSSKSYIVSISTADAEIISFLKSFYEKIGANFQIYKSKRGKCVDIRVSSKKMQEALASLGLEPCYSYEKEIPSQVLKCGKSIICAFLSGLYDTDGFAASKTIGVTSNSTKLLDQIKTILYNLGIWASKLDSFKGGASNFPNGSCECKPAWTIVIANYKDIQTFNRNIGFKIARKKDYIQSLLNDGFDRGRQVLIPDSWDYFQTIKDKYPDVKHKLFNPKTVGGHHFPQLEKNLSEAKTRSLKEFLGGSEREFMNRVLDNNLVFEKVVSSEIKMLKTYDVTVNNESCYVGNGIIHHNTYCAALFAALYAIFYPGVKIGLLASNFRQAKFIFKYIADLAASNRGELFRQCGFKMNKNPDAWEMTIGTSKIYALPLASGDRIRGYRFNLILLDEALLLTEEIVNSVIRPFLNVNMDPQKRKETLDSIKFLLKERKITEEEAEEYRNTLTPQKFICLSSASYTFEFLYKMMRDYENKILTPQGKDNPGPFSHTVFKMSYKMAPEGLLSEANIAEAKQQMSAAQFTREYESKFTDDSDSFFSPKKMAEATVPNFQEPATRIFGDKKKKYVLSIDPNYSDSENSDHFAMALLELDEENKVGTLVHGYALSKSNIMARAHYLMYLLLHFNIVYIIVDNAGGTKFINDVNELPIFRDKGIELKFFEEDFENVDYMEALKVARKSYNLDSKKICHSRTFQPSWIRLANEHLSSAIETGKIRFAAEVPPETRYDDQVKYALDTKYLHFDEQGREEVVSEEDNQNKKVDLIERQPYLIKLTKTECSLIEVKASATGVQTFDLPPNLKSINTPDKPRKDSYTALLLAAWGAKCYFDLMDAPENNGDFFVVGFN